MCDVLMNVGDIFFLTQTLADEFQMHETRWE